MALVSLLFGFFAFVGSLVHGDVDCSEQDACQAGDYKCSGDGCIIDCTGQNACDFSQFTCTESCTVDCSSQNSCEDSEFTFYDYNIDVDCNSQESCKSATLTGNNGTVLSVSCNGQQSCGSLTIIMNDESTFSISCYGQEACEGVKCVCEDNSGCETSGDFECDDGYLKRKTLHSGKLIQDKKSAPTTPLKKMLG